jgi:hypothetical protein
MKAFGVRSTGSCGPRYGARLCGIFLSILYSVFDACLSHYILGIKYWFLVLHLLASFTVSQSKLHQESD